MPRISVDMFAAQKAMNIIGLRKIELTLTQARTQETLNDIGIIEDAFSRAALLEEEPVPVPGMAPEGETDDPATPTDAAAPPGLPAEVKATVQAARPAPVKKP